jgi:hypothetical protein
VLSHELTIVEIKAEISSEIMCNLEGRPLVGTESDPEFNASKMHQKNPIF